jgi:hypothetical protein
MADMLDTPRVNRLSHRAGVVPVAANFVPSAGFGATASVGTIVGTEGRCSFVVTSAGAGQAANPTIAFTFPAGAFRDVNGATVVPIAIATRGGGDQPTIQFSTSCTATVCTLTFMGTPVAAQTYTVNLSVEA